jgi:hypothetical protein
MVPIRFLYEPTHDRLAGIGGAWQELVSQEECEIQMTNPHPQPADPALIPGSALSIPAPAAPPIAAQPDSLLVEEIRILRERGLTDECIHGLFSGFNIDARPETSGQHWNLPINDQLIRLIWGNALPTPIHLD